MEDAELSLLAEFLGIIGVESRLRLIDLLLEYDSICVNGLARRLGITQSAVSQHLRLLHLNGLVRSEREGYFVHYSVEREKLEEMLHLLRRLCAEREGGRTECRPEGGRKCAEKEEGARGLTG